MIEAIQLLRNIGRFENVAGAQFALQPLVLLRAENARGKTTFSAVLRSFGSDNPSPILERKRLGAAQPPHVVLRGPDGQNAVFQNGAWVNRFAKALVFDEHFVAENVCSGMEVDAEHRGRLHEWIIGAQGVALNNALEAHIERVEQHNRDLRAKAAAIPEGERGGLTVDEFCSLEEQQDVNTAIEDKKRELAATRNAAAVQERGYFQQIAIPSFDIEAIEALLTRTIDDLAADAAAGVHAHIAKVGEGAEAWLGDGMNRIAVVSEQQKGEICPFCGQDLAGSALIDHFRAYFGDAYRGLREAITEIQRSVEAEHGAEARNAFERALRRTDDDRQFWQDFVEIPEANVDNDDVVAAWQAAADGVIRLLAKKEQAPLEQLALTDEVRAKIDAFEEARRDVEGLSARLAATREAIDGVKERVAGADVEALENDLQRLELRKARHSDEVAPLCDAYLDEYAAKLATERERDAARQELDQYRNQVFPRYEQSINRFLERFGANFRLANVRSVNTRGGSQCNYVVVIEGTGEVEVPLTTNTVNEPCFRNTLSAGDRNALALAFFFASLGRDPQLQDKIVVIDDPMTSLDEHRALTTVQELLRLRQRVRQLIVLSHSRSFLCELWEQSAQVGRVALQITRGPNGSTLEAWDVQQDCITLHDRNHKLVRDYVDNGLAGRDPRDVAEALRPILEAFLRVAYPAWFPPGTLIGPFLGMCEQRVGGAEEILSQDDCQELRELKDYANRFHHDTNPAWRQEVINDGELLVHARRTLAFSRR